MMMWNYRKKKSRESMTNYTIENIIILINMEKNINKIHNIHYGYKL